MAPTYVTVFRTRPKGDFLVLPYRLRVGSSDRDARGIVPILVTKADYCGTIADVVLRELDLFRTRVADDQFWRADYPPLRAWAASVTDHGEDLELKTLKRHHGGHVGTGEPIRIPRSDAPRLLAHQLLVAMAEREKAIDTFMRRYSAAT